MTEGLSLLLFFVCRTNPMKMTRISTSKILGLLGFFLFSLILVSGEDTTYVAKSVTYNSDTKSFTVTDGPDDYYADAYGYYYINYNESGWNYLDLFMQSEIDSIEDHQTYSKSFGFLEGYLTCNEIKEMWPNFYSGMFGDGIPGPQTIVFLQENYRWMKVNAEKYASSDEYWYAIKTTLLQLEGLFEGYVAGCGSETKTAVTNVNVDVDVSSNPWKTLENPTLEHFLMINAWGDLYQITMKYLEAGHDSRLRGNRRAGGEGERSEKSKWDPLHAEDWKLVERCSAFVKILSNQADVIFGHNTWDTYESMSPRIIKHYSFPLTRGGFAEHHYDIYFSSSPALLSSVDDWYTLSGYAHLGVMETTNSLYNLTLLELVNPQTVLSWARVVVSNQVASNGYNWAENYARYHSGTYTNQYMVLDYKLFQAGQTPSTGFFTVFEEVPGLVHYEDQTEYLNNHGYWPSYNNPFYEDIFEASGYAALCAIASEFCHDTAPRALIFAEYQDTVVDIPTAEALLSHNDWQHDSASKKDSCNTIACRGDLELKSFSNGAYGALDGKIASVLEANKFPGNPPTFYARFGATHQQQAVFCWSTYAQESEYSHLGHPDCFDYEWMTFPPETAAGL